MSLLPALAGLLLLVLSPTAARAQAQPGGRLSARAAQTQARTLTVRTQPKAIVWVSGVRRGVTDDAGQLVVKNVPPGRHTLRVRAVGFAERTLPLPPAQRGALVVRLLPTGDEAELTFQKAEEAAEKAGNEAARREAADLYRRALKLRPRFAAARVGLARVLLALDDYDAALAEVEAARRDRPGYAEASVVEGRVHRAASDLEPAVAAFRRAIREARGFQPEAYAGLGLAFEEEGNYEEAAASISKALAQLSDTEPVLYEVLGRIYEKLERWKEAVAAYEKYLALAPDGKLAPAVNSIIDQLRRQAAEQP